MGLEEIAQIFGEDVTAMRQAGDNAIMGDDLGKPEVIHVEHISSEKTLNSSKIV